MASFQKESVRSRSQSARNLPNIPNSPEWFLAHPPNSGWEFMEIDGQPRWVPRARRMDIIQGVNGVDKNGSARNLFEGLRNNGWTVIENGGDAGEYVAPYDTARGGTAWISTWDDILELGPNRHRVRRSDEGKAAFAKWRSELVDRGVIPEPHPAELDDICDVFERNHIRRLAPKRGNAEVDRQVELATAKLEKMRKATVRAPKTRSK